MKILNNEIKIPTSTTGTAQYSGTSYAAPHVSGFYAAVKAASPGASVADVTAWVVTTDSIPVTVNLPGVGNQIFRRIKAPNQNAFISESTS